MKLMANAKKSSTDEEKKDLSWLAYLLQMHPLKYGRCFATRRFNTQ